MSSEIPDIESVLPRIEWVKAETMLTKTLVIERVLDRRKGEFGEFLVIQVKDENNTEVNVQIGGSVAINQLDAIADKNAFPVRAMLVKKTSESGGNEFYQFVSPDPEPKESDDDIPF